MKLTRQMEEWVGEFGKKYTDRNAFTTEQLNQAYEKDYGVTRSGLNEEFLGSMERSINILEIGSNVGTQLALLQKMGFENLYGIEINNYAIELSKVRTKNINIIYGSALDIPFKDGYFDLVFTSGVLIHISPHDLRKAITEIHRCTKKHIWGFEYYCEEPQEVIYRGNADLLWKTDFAKTYIDTFPDLKLERVRYLKYSQDNNIDVMFLLKKNADAYEPAK